MRNVTTYRVLQIENGATAAILSHCKYSENPMTELRGNWWTSAILYAEHSYFCLKISSRCGAT